VYTFNSASLEILREARRRGLFTVMEQTITPKAVEEQILQGERERWGGWETHSVDGFAPAYAAREAEEWALADLIVCGPSFVQEGIAQAGGPVERCRVVTYGVSLPPQPERAEPRGGALRVLFVGTVGLRKGVQYLAQAAALLGRERFTIRVVGPIDVTAH